MELKGSIIKEIIEFDIDVNNTLSIVFRNNFDWRFL